MAEEMMPERATLYRRQQQQNAQCQPAQSWSGSIGAQQDRMQCTKWCQMSDSQVCNPRILDPASTAIDMPIWEVGLLCNLLPGSGLQDGADFMSALSSKAIHEPVDSIYMSYTCTAPGSQLNLLVFNYFTAGEGDHGAPQATPTITQRGGRLQEEEQARLARVLTGLGKGSHD